MNETYLVTGAARGLGAEFVRQLLQKGHRVIAAVRRPEDAAELSKLGALVEKLDLNDRESFKAFAGRVGPIDVLLNNAAILQAPGIDTDSTLEKLSFDIFEKVFHTNVFGMALLTQALLPNLRAGKTKVIVNITSGMGSMTHTSPGISYAYSMSKAAVNMLTVQEHQELKSKGFIVICLDPGWNKTDMGGEQAPLDPSHTIAGMVSLIGKLAADDSGTFFRYDGSKEAW